MDNLVSQVPELKLKKSVETRSIHRNDLSNPKYKGMRVGSEIKLVTWHAPNGKQWTKADIMFYIQMQELKENIFLFSNTEMELTHG